MKLNDYSSAEAIDLLYIYDYSETGTVAVPKQAVQTLSVDVVTGGSYDWTMQMQTGTGEQSER